MKYWSFESALRSSGERRAIEDAERGIAISYSTLQESVTRAATVLGQNERILIILFSRNDSATIVAYLAALAAGHAVFLAPIGIDHAAAAKLIDAYRPEVLLWAEREISPQLAIKYTVEKDVAGLRMARRKTIEDPPPHSSIGLLLSTSGSSGSPKAVRLPLSGLEPSAIAVVESLSMRAGLRVLASLPFGYVYGLSVLHSALLCGGTLVLVSGSPASREYWRRVTRAQPEMLPVVSHSLEMMKHYGIDADDLPNLRKIIHSGDALHEDLFDWTYQRFGDQGVEIFLMYGQTEAGGRMTVLEPKYLPELRRSVGRPLGGCEIKLDEAGHILFRGPGVMIGYAEGRKDLTEVGTAMQCVHTGDRGHIDERGFLYINGRISRDRKVFDRRINLDEVAAFVSTGRDAAVVENDGVVSIVFQGKVPAGAATVMEIARYFQVPPQALQIIALPEWPMTRGGKVALHELTEMMSLRLPPGYRGRTA